MTSSGRNIGTANRLLIFAPMHSANVREERSFHITPQRFKRNMRQRDAAATQVACGPGPLTPGLAQSTELMLTAFPASAS